MKLLRYIFGLLLLALSLNVSAQKFFNLTAQNVKIDSVLPHFSYSMPLGDDYADSIYTVSIQYPEYIDMSPTDISNYNKISGSALPETPSITQRTVISRKRGTLEVTFCPLVYKDNKYQILVGFMLKVEARPIVHSLRVSSSTTSSSSRYAEHSVLASGKWAKIRVPSSGVYQITDALIRKAGFTDINKVRVYGYGGRLQNETLKASDLITYDDLKAVSLYEVNGRRFFYANGPVSWGSTTTTKRTRNPYSSYGYYFITQGSDDVTTVDSATFINSFYPSADDYHTLYEVDGYSWFHGGRNLFDKTAISVGSTSKYVINNKSAGNSATLYVAISSGSICKAQIASNDSVLGNISVTSLADYDKGAMASASYRLTNVQSTDTIKITTISGGPIRLDYISLTWDQPAAAPDMAKGSFSVPEYVYNITNQDHHADSQCDMVIIIPTSQKLLTQAKRLKAYHEAHDSLSVNIVPADELYNEYSSGTPDVNAYRRYLKMLYDRASTDEDMPKYLLLLGDCVWDNRMLTGDCQNLDPDDYLLCFESENSFNKVSCYVDDGFFCLLDDGEGGNPQETDKLDVAVGRFPVTTDAEAKILVDKTINYGSNTNAGSWQNTLMFMGDDGNQNLHMDDANDVADDVATKYPGYLIKKVIWDAYTRETSSTGNTYPEVTRIIKQQQAAGALIMDYAGHGSETQISHEAVLRITDFASFTNTNLPLWITASCDIMPFDDTGETIGETAILNKNGGAVAFFGTTRTVYANYNKMINRAYLRRVLSKVDGKPITIGEAQRLAKNDMIANNEDKTTNKLQYTLLGDPALALNQPTVNIVIDSINGVDANAGTTSIALKAGSIATVKGHIENATDFNGIVTATVRDSRELITCKLNNTSSDGATTAFTYYDRTKTLFNGSDSVAAGKFNFSFAVPKDINYSDATGLINVYAVNDGKTLEANGYNESFTIGGSDIAENDSIGPSIYCYLNSPSFTNGGNVNTTPYFVAQISDEDGINATGNGIGHDMELIIDGEMSGTYLLNNNFSYDFGSYTKGSTYYNIPELSEGKHTLLFRAWDILNNSSTAQLSFNVVKGLSPSLFSISCSKNPATTSTTFIINHDRSGSDMDVDIEVFDMSGRILWKHEESGVNAASTYTVDWDLTVDGGGKLQTGVYLYRIGISSEGSKNVSKAKKLIVIGNN